MSLESRNRLSESVKKVYASGAKVGFQKGHKFLGKNIGEIMRGRKPWNAGKKIPYKPRPSMRGRATWLPNFPKGNIPWNKGKPGSMRGRMPKGENHWAWKGGTRQLRKDIQDIGEYKTWRTACFERDKYACVSCGDVGGKLIVDHKKAFSEIIYENKVTTLEEALACSQLWDISNGRTLCEDCHKETPTYGLKQVRRLKNQNT